MSESNVPPGSDKKWTVMFLLAGDSGISASMISQLKAITDAGFEENTNVLVYFDPNCNGMNARIFNVNAKRRKLFAGKGKPTLIGDGEDPYVRNIQEDCFQPGLPQIPASVSLRYFLTYSRTKFPAKNYILFLEGHGVIVGNDTFLPDADDDSSITLAELGAILKDFGDKVRQNQAQFHLVGFQSCSMNSVEVVYELQGTARYMLGAQGFAFANSWPFRQLLKKIFIAIKRPENKPLPGDDRYPTPTVREILDGLQDLSFYNAVDFWLAGLSSDISMCSLDEAKVSGERGLDPPLKELATSLVKALDDPISKGHILRAHLESQSYFAENYTDLYDFCSRLKEFSAPQTGALTGLSQACQNVMNVLESDGNRRGPDPKGDYQRLVVYSDFFGPSYQYSNGLSIYFPWRAPEQRILDRYSKYAFHEKAGAQWLEFLGKYFIETRRDVRSKQPMDVGKNGHVSLVKSRTAEEWAQVSDEELLNVGRPIKLDKPSGPLATPPSDKTGGALAEPSDKTGGALAEPSDKTGGALAEPSDKTGGALAEPSDKTGGALAELSDKTGGALAEPSDKTGGALGLFGLTIIKNFGNPEDAVVTSRPNGHPWRGPRTGR